jgi:hypothetical protein
LTDFLRRGCTYGYSYGENSSALRSILKNRSAVFRRILKNLKMPFTWSEIVQNQKLIFIILPFLFEIAFGAGGFYQKPFKEESHSMMVIS